MKDFLMFIMAFSMIVMLWFVGMVIYNQKLYMTDHKQDSIKISKIWSLLSGVESTCFIDNNK